MEMDGFDRLPDSLILLIFNSVSDIKTLILCLSVSKRFNSLVPQTDSLLLKVDRVISPDSDTDSLLLTFLKLVFKSIHDLFKLDHKPTPTLTLTQNSPCQILRRFDRIKQLAIELPSGDLKSDDKPGVIIKWRANFGKTLKSCVILGFHTVAGSSSDFACDLKARVVWTINALITASARHYYLKEIVKEHEEIEELILKDKGGEGVVVMNKEDLKECRNETTSFDNDDWDEFDTTVVPSVRMRMRHESKVLLKNGSFLEGATLVVVKPFVGKESCGVAAAADMEDAELAIGAFGGGDDEEAVQVLLKSKSYLLEMNSF